MTTLYVVLAAGVAGAVVYQFGYRVGRRIERNRWIERGHSIWDREQR